MSTEPKGKSILRGALWSAALALPFAALILGAVLKWGPTLRDLIHVLIKMVVIA